MRTNIAIIALIYPMVQAVVFGLGMLGLLVFGAPSSLFPVMIAATFVIALPIAVVIGPRLRSRLWRRRHGDGLKPS
jgi:hypothetical protein